jgi:Zn finger protein HypA/HybF involved in hydrogenase expression
MNSVHELSLCDDLLSLVVAIAAQHCAQSVESITVQIGALSGVEPILLESAFALIKLRYCGISSQIDYAHITGNCALSNVWHSI